MQWTFREILTAMGGRAAAQVPDTGRFSSISTDSRQTEPGALFFALRGPRHDGHDFVAEALRRGALAAVVEHDITGVAASTLIRVPETLTALGDLAAWTRRQHVPTVVGITGSNGKTTTKEMVAAICDAGHPRRGKIGVLKTEGNLNNLVGLPLTLLGARGDEWVAVLEMGMNRPGEIARLTEITRPDYAIITNVAPAHLQGVGGTVAGVAAAKGELVAGLSQRAVIAVNVDDAWVRRLCMLFPGRKITFGHNADVQARHVVELGADGVAFELVIGRQAVKVRLRLVGVHNVSNALGAAAIGHALGLDGAVIARGLERGIGPAMRMQAKRLPNGVTLINDAYNANPSSVEAALVALRRFSGRPVVVLGEMRELGDESRRAGRAPRGAPPRDSRRCTAVSSWGAG
ncbi:MAG: UDP-N-acetylmuramoyl-tripeptide--D-alanyl-D-alanine ligase [Candidatus Binatia bacterium]